MSYFFGEMADKIKIMTDDLSKMMNSNEPEKESRRSLEPLTRLREDIRAEETSQKIEQENFVVSFLFKRWEDIFKGK